MFERHVLRLRMLLERVRIRTRLRAMRADERSAKRSSGSDVRIAALHYWDSRPKFRDVWPLNARIVDHNFRVLEDRAPRGQSVDHFVVLHEVSGQPAVEQLLPRLAQGRSIEVVRVRMDLSPYQHPHKMTFVVKQSLETLASRLARYDYLFMTPQDTLLVNHSPINFLDLLRRVAEGLDGPGIADVVPPGHGGRGYASHTVGRDPNWALFTHNAAFGRGLFPVRKLPYVELAAQRSGDWIPAERYLGEILGEQSTYLRPSASFYHGDYPMEDLTPERTDQLLRLVQTVTGTRSLVDAAAQHWAGGLRPPWTGFKGAGSA